MRAGRRASQMAAFAAPPSFCFLTAQHNNHDSIPRFIETMKKGCRVESHCLGKLLSVQYRYDVIITDRGAKTIAHLSSDCGRSPSTLTTARGSAERRSRYLDQAHSHRSPPTHRAGGSGAWQLQSSAAAAVGRHEIHENIEALRAVRRARAGMRHCHTASMRWHQGV